MNARMSVMSVAVLAAVNTFIFCASIKLFDGESLTPPFTLRLHADNLPAWFLPAFAILASSVFALASHFATSLVMVNNFDAYKPNCFFRINHRR